MEKGASFLCSFPAKLELYEGLVFSIDVSSLDPRNLSDGGEWFFAINAFSDHFKWSKISRRTPLNVAGQEASLPDCYTFISNKSYERQDWASSSKKHRALQFFTKDSLTQRGSVTFDNKTFYRIDDLSQTRELKIKVVGVVGTEPPVELKAKRVNDKSGNPWQYLSLNVCLLRL